MTLSLDFGYMLCNELVKLHLVHYIITWYVKNNNSIMIIYMTDSTSVQETERLKQHSSKQVGSSISSTNNK